MARNAWITGAIAGVFLGALAGWMARGQAQVDRPVGPAPPPGEGQARGAEPAPDAKLAAVSDAPQEARASSGERQPALPSGEPEELFSQRLLEYAAAGIRTGWGFSREDQPTDEEMEEGLETFREQTLAVPGWVGRQLAERRSEAELALEDARTGGVFSVLERLDEGGTGRLFEVVDSAEVFGQFFQREHGGPSLDGGNGAGQREPVPDGSTLFFPAGVHSVGDFGSNWREHFPRDLTIRGAGRDNTLIVLRSSISAYDTVRNLTFENCTIHANNKYLFDVRRPMMSVTIRSCRLVGWMTGAGASCLFGTKALALRVIDTQITGVYNRHPEYGQLFDVRTNGLLARFENCSFEALDMFDGTRDGATLVFANCQTKDIFGPRSGVPGSVRLLGTEVDWFAGEDPAEVKRDLDELFPDWESELRRAR